MDMYYMKLFLSQVKYSSWHHVLGADNVSKVRKNGDKKTTKERGVVALLLKDLM